MPMHAIAYVALLAAVALWSGLRGQVGLSRASVVTAGNCLFGTAFVLGFGIYDPWQFFIALNLASAWVVLIEPAGRAQAVVAGMYVALAVLDATYGAATISGHVNEGAAASYIFNSAIVGWGQLSVLFIGSADDDNGRSRMARWFGSRFGANLATYFARLAQPDEAAEA
jgi:hypothetical protein